MKTTKTVKKLQCCRNELEISQKIKEISYFFLYFSPIQDHTSLNISEIDQHFLESSTHVAPSKEYVLLLKECQYFASFSDFFQNISNPREKVLHFFDSYVYLLNAIDKLTTNDLVYFRVLNEKIGFNKKKQPILYDFSESFCINDFSLDKDATMKRFNKFAPEDFTLPLEYHIITFLNDESREKVSISQLNIEEICKNFIVKNQPLRGFSEDFIKKFYKSCVSQPLSLSIINETRENIVKKMLQYANTWDNYSLSVFFLQIVNKMIENTGTENTFLNGFSQLLLLNIDPNPEKRLPALETMSKFKDLFTNSVNWEEIHFHFHF